MIFQDTTIKKYLTNVYFVTGTPCGGKTTACKTLSARYGIPVYNVDEMFAVHQRKADPINQPNMCRAFADADEFFSRSAAAYRAWLTGSTAEQLDFVLLDLIRLSQHGTILCDCHLTPEQAEQITEPSRIAFLIREPVNLADEYCARPDHTDFRDFLYSASDPGQAKKLCSETLELLHRPLYDTVRTGKWFSVDREEGLTADETADKIAAHFGLQKPETVEIVQVQKDAPLAAELVRFIENCSWAEAKDHIAALLRNWDFADSEAVFAAVADGRPVGMTALLNTDYYPLPDVFPWVTCVFVTETHRGKGISGQMIVQANAYAKSLGYHKTHIASSFFGLYERFGYRYLHDIVNYGGGTDHLFVKAL